MLDDAELVAFLPTTDVDRARVFFGDVLGLPILEESPFAYVFDANGTRLRVTPVETAVIAPYTVLGWEVSDVRATLRMLVDRGVSFERFDGMPQDELGIWTTPGGDLIAWFKDPDGNLLSLAQLAVPGS